MPQPLDLAMQTITCRPSLEANVQGAVTTRQFLDQLADRARPVLDLAQESGLTVSTTFGNRHSMLQLCRIEGDKRFAILSHGPSLHA
jgi:hypothetical protein